MPLFALKGAPVFYAMLAGQSLEGYMTWCGWTGG